MFTNNNLGGGVGLGGGLGLGWECLMKDDFRCVTSPTPKGPGNEWIFKGIGSSTKSDGPKGNHKAVSSTRDACLSECLKMDCGFYGVQLTLS